MRSNDGGAQHAAAQRTGRKLVDMAQKARGRTPLKYEMTIIPFFCGEARRGLLCAVAIAALTGALAACSCTRPGCPPAAALYAVAGLTDTTPRAGELPSGLDKLSFVWERGSKVFATEAEPVNPHTKACFWQQYLKQVSPERDAADASSLHEHPAAYGCMRRPWTAGRAQGCCAHSHNAAAPHAAQRRTRLSSAP